MATLFEGVLYKKGRINPAWKIRYCDLQKRGCGTVVLQYRESKSSTKLLGEISISDCYALEIVPDYDLKLQDLPELLSINSTTRSDKKCTFIISTSDRKWVFAAADPQCFKQWINALHQYVYGGITRQGWLEKRGDYNKAWKRRYFILNQHHIRYYDDFERTKYLGTIQLNEVIAVENSKTYLDAGHRFVFELVSNKRVWILCAEDEDDRDSWKEVIQQSERCKSSRHQSRKTTDLALEIQMTLLRQKLDITNRTRLFKTYPNCFVGSDAVKQILALKMAETEEDAIEFGQSLMNQCIIRHVENQPCFTNDNECFQFTLNYKVIEKESPLNAVAYEYQNEEVPFQLKAELLESRLEIKDRKYHLKLYARCFVGSDAISKMMQLRLASNEQEAIRFGTRLMTAGLIEHVVDAKTFETGNFYRFTDQYYKRKQQDIGGNRATLRAFRKLVSQDTLWDVSANSIDPESANEIKFGPLTITKTTSDGIVDYNSPRRSSLISNLFLGMTSMSKSDGTLRSRKSMSTKSEQPRESLIGTVGSFLKSLTPSSTTLATDASPFAAIDQGDETAFHDHDHDEYSSSSSSGHSNSNHRSQSGSMHILDDIKIQEQSASTYIDRVDCGSGSGGSLEDCECLTRMIMVIRFYQKNFDDEDTVKMYLKTYTDFLNDYHHILDVHLNENTVPIKTVDAELKGMYRRMVQYRNELRCDINSCPIYLRHNQRRREIEDDDEKEKEKDIDDSTTSSSSPSSSSSNKSSRGHLMDILDGVHCMFVHAVDAGYCLLDAYDCKNFKERHMAKTRSALQALRGKTRMRHNKFVTLVQQEQIALVDQKEDDWEEAMDQDANDVPLQDGFGAYYDFWSDVSEHTPKYDKLKTEMTQNMIYRISLKAFDKAYQKALYLYNQSMVFRKMKSVAFSYNNGGYKYGVDGGLAMDIQHILAVILYTEFDTLAFHLKGTFKKLSFIESHQKMMSRNGEYYHWSKLLIESVNCFGTTVEEACCKVFYHGTTANPLDNLTLKLNCPVSTTTRLHVQRLYARDDGVILELVKGHGVADRSLRFLDCRLFSNTPLEQERLFMSPPAAYVMRLQSVYDMALGCDYVEYLEAMQRLEEVVQGINVRDQLTECNLRNIKSLMAMSMKMNSNGKEVASSSQIQVAPPLIRESFMKWTASKEIVILDIALLNASYPEMKGLLLVNEHITNLVALDRVNAVFREMEAIECRHIGTVDVHAYIPLLLSILEKLNEVECKVLDRIYLKDIDNAYAFATNFEKVQSAICRQHWKIRHEVSALIITRCRSCSDSEE